VLYRRQNGAEYFARLMILTEKQEKRKMSCSEKNM
jgi:hypothetical protein